LGTPGDLRIKLHRKISHPKERSVCQEKPENEVLKKARVAVARTDNTLSFLLNRCLLCKVFSVLETFKLHGSI